MTIVMRRNNKTWTEIGGYILDQPSGYRRREMPKARA
jgi:hypothetical protein